MVGQDSLTVYPHNLALSASDDSCIESASSLPSFSRAGQDSLPVPPPCIALSIPTNSVTQITESAQNTESAEIAQNTTSTESALQSQVYKYYMAQIVCWCVNITLNDCFVCWHYSHCISSPCTYNTCVSVSEFASWTRFINRP